MPKKEALLTADSNTKTTKTTKSKIKTTKSKPRLREKPPASANPIRNFSLFLRLTFAKSKEPELFDRITLSMREGVLKVTCHDDETYQKMKLYEAEIPVEIVAYYGLKEMICQLDVYYAVLKVLKDFEQQGKTNFSADEVTQEVNKFGSQRTLTRIRGVLNEFCHDIASRGYEKDRMPKWLLDMRGVGAVVTNLGNSLYMPSPKPLPKPKKAKKTVPVKL